MTKETKPQSAAIIFAIKILTAHQKWRTGKTDEIPFTPKELTGAIDTILIYFKKLK